MHAEEFDFSEDESEEDLHEEERFSFAEELAEPTSPQALDDVEAPEPPMPNTAFPTISLDGDDEPVPTPLEPLSLHEPGETAGTPGLSPAVGELHSTNPSDPSHIPLSLEGEPSPGSEGQDAGGVSATQPAAGAAPALPGGELDIDPLDAFRGMDVIEGTVRGGNRPAKGARQISAGEILSGNFRGSAAAGDFLGLDTEFTGPSDPLGSVHELVDHQPEYPPSYEDDFDESTEADYDDVEGPELRTLSAPSAEDFAPPADPYDSDEEYEEEEEEYEELEYHDPAGAPLRLVLVTVVCAVLGAGGVFLAPKILSGEMRIPGMDWIRGLTWSEEATEVAMGPANPTPTPTRTPLLPPTATPSDSTSGEPASGEVPVDEPTPAAPVVVSATEPAPVSDPASEPATALEVESPGETPANPFAEITTAPTEVPRASGVDLTGSGLETTPMPPAVLEDPVVAQGDSAAPPSGGVGRLMENLIGPELEGRSGFPDLATSDIGWISDDRLDLIWRGEEIPAGALQGPAKTLMPRVGVVRVTMQSEQIFEGRLYAAGQNGLWLEFARGRIKLPASEIAEVERLAVVAEEVASSEATAATGKRVRATVPGGHIFGRVQKQHGGLVTIRTDSGATVVVESQRVEALGARRAVLIHR